MKRKIEETEGNIQETNDTGKTEAQNGEIRQSEPTSYKKGLFAPLTREEISSFKETENLFKSGLLRMQITELLSEVVPKKQRNKALDEVLHEVNSLLLSLPDGTGEHKLSDHSWLPNGIKFPLPTPAAPVKGKFCFRKPTSVKVVGSYLLGTVTKPDLNVDISVQMPKECFHSKDFLNLRYHHKRALYLAVLASHLKQSSFIENVKFIHMNGEVLRPILLLKPKGLKVGKKFVIKLHPCLSEDTFKLQRCAPNMNNIEQDWFMGEAAKEDDSSDSSQPTPHYNASILSDMFLEQHLHHLYKCLQDFSGMKDAVALIKVWLHQRELDKGPGCCSGFLVSMFISHLLAVRKVNKHMSSYQILRIFLQFLGSTDLTKEGIIMSNEDSSVPLKEEFHSAYDVVFVDPSGYLNLCAGMTVAQYRRLQHEARLAMEYLDSAHLDGFEILFMKPVPFVQTFDHFLLIPNMSALEVICQRKDFMIHLRDHPGDWTPVVADWLLHLLTKGLGKRVEMLCYKPQELCQWPVNKAPPSASRSSLMLGLMLNAEHFDAVIDTGPSADKPEAKAFREFWGEKSELRRFHDSSILEAVVWPCKNIAERRVVCERIIKHLVQRHGGLKPDCLTFVATQLDGVLHTAGSSDSGTQAGDEKTQKILQVYDSLCKEIRALDLPLSVSAIQGVSPVFRGAEVFPPNPCFKNSKIKPSADDSELPNNVLIPSEIRNTAWCPAFQVMLQFETSGKWPNELTAVQHVKAAFHIKLAELLRTKCSLVTVASPKHIDVQKEGFVFSIKIMHHGELTLLKKMVKEKKTGDEEKAKELEKEIVHLPLLASFLHGIKQKFIGFSGTVRLSKRWISAQLLSDHVTEECVELLVTYLFLSPAPFTPPRSPLVGFLRFLNLLSSTDWQKTPIIVNFNDDITAEDYQEITSTFTKNRAELPALFIATPKDKFSLWTKEKPSKQILSRLSLLARESQSILQRQVETCALQPTDFKQIFRPPLDHYDVIIHLHRHLLSRGVQALDCCKPVKELASSSRPSPFLPVVNFDPAALYLKELKEAFADVALFFHDVYGGNLIGVVWKPQSFVVTKFKPLQAYHKMPLTNPLSSEKSKQPKSLMIPNVSAILTDFQTIGEGLVKRIEVMSA
ncbi:nucleolar protein 6-like [Acropora muricata]|uniref:nucleolar protein 6-like n=1 Tax=Acropora muricata TaxID=159855 RepID=UPI0034E56713